jgi:hypothetical protein
MAANWKLSVLAESAGLCAQRRQWKTVKPLDCSGDWYYLCLEMPDSGKNMSRDQSFPTRVPLNIVRDSARNRGINKYKFWNTAKNSKYRGNFCPAIGNTGVISVCYQLPDQKCMTGLGTVLLNSHQIHKYTQSARRRTNYWTTERSNFEDKIQWSVSWCVLDFNKKRVSCHLSKKSEHLPPVFNFLPLWTSFLMSDKH